MMWKTITWQLKYVITSEKGIVRTSNHLDLVISASKYYWFPTNMQTFVLKLWQDKENFQDMEGLVLNCIEISVEIQDVEIFKDMEIFQDLEANITHSIS